MDIDDSIADRRQRTNSLPSENGIHAPGPPSTQEHQQQSQDMSVTDPIVNDEGKQQASGTSSEPLLGESTMNEFGDWINDI